MECQFVVVYDENGSWVSSSQSDDERVTVYHKGTVLNFGLCSVINIMKNLYFFLSTGLALFSPSLCEGSMYSTIAQGCASWRANTLHCSLILVVDLSLLVLYRFTVQ